MFSMMSNDALMHREALKGLLPRSPVLIIVGFHFLSAHYISVF